MKASTIYPPGPEYVTYEKEIPLRPFNKLVRFAPPSLSRLGGASPVRLSLLGWRAGLSGSRPACLTCSESNGGQVAGRSQLE